MQHATRSLFVSQGVSQSIRFLYWGACRISSFFEQLSTCWGAKLVGCGTAKRV